MGWQEVSEAVCNDFNDASLPQHPELDSMDLNIGKQSVNLRAHKLRVDGRDLSDCLGILCGQSRYHSAAIGTQGAHRLDVGQNTSAPRGIHACDGQGIGYDACGSFVAHVLVFEARGAMRPVVGELGAAW